MGGARRVPGLHVKHLLCVVCVCVCVCVCVWQALARLKQELAVEFPACEVKAEFMSLDLSSFLSTQQFVTAFKEKNLPLHILINNAGIALVPQGGATSCVFMEFMVTKD